MLDLRRIRENPKEVEAQLRRREPDLSLDHIVEIDQQLRELMVRADQLRSYQNTASKEIAQRKRDGQDTLALMAEMTEVADQVKSLEQSVRQLEGELEAELVLLPNLPHPSVPADMDKRNNVVARTWGTKREFDFATKNHLELGKNLRLLDLERASKISGAQFPLYLGWGTRLEQALLNFMLDENTAKGYTPVIPPYLVNATSMFTSGNLPKFADQLYQCKDNPYYLVPTAEVPLTNLHRDEILEEEQLPLKYTAFTVCFRREAGTYGSEERGLVRMHQFNKVELYKYTTPETSYDELESLVRDAEDLLQKLELHYHVSLLVTGDIGQQAAKTYDLEVWLPGQNSYYEVSSCSNCEDYQARRGMIRYRPKEGEGKGKAKPRLLHTLNGSGLATSRLLISILENNQQADGSVVIPQALRKYLGGQAVLTP